MAPLDSLTLGRRSCDVRLNLDVIGAALEEVEQDWPRIDSELERLHIGRKDPFTALLRHNMQSAYAYLDDLLVAHVAPATKEGIEHMLALNNRVHYGSDETLMADFAPAIAANAEKFYANVDPIAAWIWKHAADGDHPYKLAAETYVSILGHPQLFVEGNHRTGSLIASWISLNAGYPPFVLSVDNAVAYFAPSAEIKWFADKSTWRGRARLPKYRKRFRDFWESHLDPRYVRLAD